MAATPALMNLLLTVLSLQKQQQDEQSLAAMSFNRETASSYMEKGHINAKSSDMTVYAVAVGQGDGNIIACPNGEDILVVDMGANNPLYVERDYGSYILKNKFSAVNKKKKIHLVVTHPDTDHYNSISKVFDDDLLPQLSSVVLGGNFEEYSKSFREWLTTKQVPVFTVNNGRKCFGNSDCMWTPVTSESIANELEMKSTQALYQHLQRAVLSGGDSWQFCGRDVDIKVLGANIGPKSSKNGRSVIMKLTYKKWSMFLGGDFEGIRAQKELINQWPGTTLQSTYYKISHHGAWKDKNKANLPQLLDKILPKKAYVSQGHPDLSEYRHPDCQVINNLLQVGSIEKISNPNENAPFVCYNQTTEMSETKPTMDYAIYETCRSVKNGQQVCQDIRIVTNGYSDTTEYVDVPPEYVYQRQYLLLDILRRL